MLTYHYGPDLNSDLPDCYGRNGIRFLVLHKEVRGESEGVDAARAVFDETLQDEENEPKPAGVRLETCGGRSDYAVLDQ
jgi:hypothetical protein